MISTRHILPSLLVGLVATFLLQVRPFAPATPYRLQVPLHSDAAGRASLLWGSENQSVLPDYDATPVAKGDQVLTFFLPDTSLGTFRTRPHPKNTITAFRLNPLDHAAQVTLGEMTVLGPENETVATFPPSIFFPTRKDLDLKVEGGSATFTSQPGEGVFFMLKQPLELPRRTVPIHPATAALQFGCAALATLLVLVLAGRVPAGARARFAGALRKMRDDQAAWPVATLFVVAALATAASCYPVIFCGKSFLSPNNGAIALYGDFPTLPQSPHEIIEEIGRASCRERV